MCVSDASMADARELVGVVPLFAMRLSLAHGPLPRSKDRELTTRCRHCGNAKRPRETVAYAGPAALVAAVSRAAHQPESGVTVAPFAACPSRGLRTTTKT
jgi:hypothetical protein